MAWLIKTPHDFWLKTCGVDTYVRSKSHARLDTPWNAFRKDESCLVCTVWDDRIVPVADPKTGRVRSFVKMGGMFSEWAGLSVAHGREARSNLDRAIEEKLPILGYVAKPNATANAKGKRVVEHFDMDQVHQLKPWIGLSRETLEEELPIEKAFNARGLNEKTQPSQRPTLFELVDATVPITYELSGAKKNEAKDSDEDDGPTDLGTVGGLSNQRCAELALPLLVHHVLEQKDDVLAPLTYKELARRIGRVTRNGDPWARGMGDVLGRVTKLLDSVSDKVLDPPPFLTAVVVESSVGPAGGLPGPGVKGRWRGYESLSRDEKRSRMLLEHQRILAYGSRWNELLRLLGMDTVAPPVSVGGERAGGWGGGESEEHKALKRFVYEHPELVGAEAHWDAQEEYALRSGDEIDVMFKSPRLWIGVEVKSSVSDGNPSDYERGIYQVVKYRAVLNAQAAIDHPDAPPDIKVVLVLQNQLPKSLRPVADSLKVAFLENIGAPTL